MSETKSVDDLMIEAMEYANSRGWWLDWSMTDDEVTCLLLGKTGGLLASDATTLGESQRANQRKQMVVNVVTEARANLAGELEDKKGN